MTLVVAATLVVTACTSGDANDPPPTVADATGGETPATSQPSPTPTHPPTPAPVEVVEVINHAFAIPNEGRVIVPGTAEQSTTPRAMMPTDNGLVVYTETYDAATYDGVEITAHQFDGASWEQVETTGMQLYDQAFANFRTPGVRLPDSGDWFLPEFTEGAWGYRSTDGLNWELASSAVELLSQYDHFPSPSMAAVTRDGQVWLSVVNSEFGVVLRSGDDLVFEEVGRWPTSFEYSGVDELEVASTHRQSSRRGVSRRRVASVTFPT